MKTISILLITFFLAGCSLNSSYVERGSLFNGDYFKKNDSTQIKTPEEKIKSVASEKGGVYDSSLRLELDSNYPRASIFYSIDEDLFDISKFEKYETPILIDKDTVLKFYASYKDKKENVHQERYEIKRVVVKENPFTEEKNTIEKFVRNMNIEQDISDSETGDGIDVASGSEEGSSEEAEE